MGFDTRDFEDEWVAAATSVAWSKASRINEKESMKKNQWHSVR
jgi:hypothetical protein